MKIKKGKKMEKCKSAISWSDNYIIGNDKIDSEHKELFDIAKKANCVYTLENEEVHMKDINYPKLLDHKIEHKKLLDMVNFISLNLPILSIQKSGDELYNFVQKIFVKHIISEDTKIVEFIEQSK